MKKRYEKNSTAIKIAQKVPEEMPGAFSYMSDTHHIFQEFCHHPSSGLIHVQVERGKEQDSHPILSIKKVQTVPHGPVYQYVA